MRTNFVLSTAVSLALLCVATPARAEQGHGARSRGGWVARGTVRTVAASPRMAGRGRQVVIAPRIVTARAVARVVPRVVVRPRVFVGSPYLFSRPYYSFRPRVSLGFGLWVGYPVPYPYYYATPYFYPYPPAPYGYLGPPYAYPAPNPSAAYPPAGYPPAAGVTVQPGTTTGGVSFEITPVDAEVYVDGTHVGRVSNFGPLSQPLSVAPGRHLIEIRRAGYQTLSFDADIAAGQVIPYQGAMQPLGR